MRRNNHGQCLGEETLTEYLEGGLEPAIKAASEGHLVECEECRNKLVFWMRLLQPDVSPEEANTLETVANEWNKRTGSKAEPVQKPASRRFIVACAAAAALLIGVFSAWNLKERAAGPKLPGEVVQLLLEQKRPFESRFAGEPHLPIVRTRGVDDPGVSYGLLAGEMTRLSANSHEMGRFYLIQKDFGRAIPYLEIGEREVGATAAIHNDLGVAYLESGNSSQFEKAGSEFLHALQQDGKFAAAVFNLALFYERTNATSQAEAEWKQYLELDTKSAWAQEARGRLQGLSR